MTHLLYFASHNSLTINTLRILLRKAVFHHAKDGLSCSKRWPFAGRKTTFYKTKHHHPTLEGLHSGMSFSYFYKATFRPRHTAFIISVARYARSVHHKIAVMAQRRGQTVYRLTASHVERDVYIPREQRTPLTLNGVRTRHEFKPCAVAERQKICPQAGSRIMVHVVCRRSKVFYEKRLAPFKVFYIHGNVVYFHNVIVYLITQSQSNSRHGIHSITPFTGCSVRQRMKSGIVLTPSRSTA